MAITRYIGSKVRYVPIKKITAGKSANAKNFFIRSNSERNSIIPNSSAKIIPKVDLVTLAVRTISLARFFIKRAKKSSRVREDFSCEVWTSLFMRKTLPKNLTNSKNYYFYARLRNVAGINNHLVANL